MGEDAWTVRAEFRRGRPPPFAFSIVWSEFWGFGVVKMDANLEMYVDVFVDVVMNSGSVRPVSPGL